jgi:quercetin dioxygenase-like cupin family protein
MRDAVTPGNIYLIDPVERSLAESAVARWIFKHLAAGLESRPLSPMRNVFLRSRVLARSRELTSSQTRTVRAGEGEWRAIAPGVTIKLLRRNTSTDNMTAFIRMQPGASVEAHPHPQSEECLILEGEIFIGEHRLCAGDMHVAAAGTIHAPVTSPRGALMVVRAQLCLHVRHAGRTAAGSLLGTR